MRDGGDDAATDRWIALPLQSDLESGSRARCSAEPDCARRPGLRRAAQQPANGDVNGRRGEHQDGKATRTSGALREARRRTSQQNRNSAHAATRSLALALAPLSFSSSQMQTFVNSYKLSPAVQSLLEGGPKNARVLQRRVQELVISEKMAALVRGQATAASERRQRVRRATTRAEMIAHLCSLCVFVVQTGPQDLSAACFTDPREAFECIIAQLKMGAQVGAHRQARTERT